MTGWAARRSKELVPALEHAFKMSPSERRRWLADVLAESEHRGLSIGWHEGATAMAQSYRDCNWIDENNPYRQARASGLFHERCERAAEGHDFDAMCDDCYDRANRTTS
jgi:hypothetical protein